MCDPQDDLLADARRQRRPVEQVTAEAEIRAGQLRMAYQGRQHVAGVARIAPLLGQHAGDRMPGSVVPLVRRQRGQTHTASSVTRIIFSYLTNRFPRSPGLVNVLHPTWANATPRRGLCCSLQSTPTVAGVA